MFRFVLFCFASFVSFRFFFFSSPGVVCCCCCFICGYIRSSVPVENRWAGRRCRAPLFCRLFCQQREKTPSVHIVFYTPNHFLLNSYNFCYHLFFSSLFFLLFFFLVFFLFFSFLAFSLNCFLRTTAVFPAV